MTDQWMGKIESSDSFGQLLQLPFVFFIQFMINKNLKSLGQFINIERNNGDFYQNRKIESLASREEMCGTRSFIL